MRNSNNLDINLGVKKGIHPFYSKIWDCFRDCLKKSRSYDPTVQFKGSFIITSIMISNRDGLQLLRSFNKKDGACFMNHPLQSKEVELFGDKKWFHIHIDWNSIWILKYLCPNYFSSKLLGTFNDAMPMNGSVQNFQAQDLQPDVSTILAVNLRMCITSTINFYHFSRIFPNKFGAKNVCSSF